MLWPGLLSMSLQLGTSQGWLPLHLLMCALAATTFLAHVWGLLCQLFLLFCRMRTWSGEYLVQTQWCKSATMCCVSDLLMVVQIPRLQLLLEGISWRTISFSLIWLHQDSGLALCSLAGKLHVPTSISPPLPRGFTMMLHEIYFFSMLYTNYTL